MTIIKSLTSDKSLKSVIRRSATDKTNNVISFILKSNVLDIRFLFEIIKNIPVICAYNLEICYSCYKCNIVLDVGF